jgi:hypothetical protein
LEGLVTIDISAPGTPVILSTVWALGEFGWRIAIDGDRLYLSDISGVLVYDISDPALPAMLGSVRIGEVRSVEIFGDYLCATGAGVLGAPFSVLSTDCQLSAGIEAGATADLIRPQLNISPNPVRSGASISFTLKRAGFTDLNIYDAAGRLVRSLGAERREAGRQALHWDGRGESGAEIPSGAYFIRLRGPGWETTGRLIKVR